jgi:hypothetical protein
MTIKPTAKQTSCANTKICIFRIYRGGTIVSTAFESDTDTAWESVLLLLVIKGHVRRRDYIMLNGRVSDELERI